jgi:hypothetical protein
MLCIRIAAAKAEELTGQLKKALDTHAVARVQARVRRHAAAGGRRVAEAGDRRVAVLQSSDLTASIVSSLRQIGSQGPAHAVSAGTDGSDAAGLARSSGEEEQEQGGSGDEEVKMEMDLDTRIQDAAAAEAAAVAEAAAAAAAAEAAAAAAAAAAAKAQPAVLAAPRQQQEMEVGGGKGCVAGSSRAQPKGARREGGWDQVDEFAEIAKLIAEAGGGGVGGMAAAIKPKKG